jgi:hypothetical protein
MRQRGAQPVERNEIAEQMLPPTVAQRFEPFTSRLQGLSSGLEDVATRAVHSSPVGQIHDMYQQLQAGALPEDLAGQSFRTALDMLLWGTGEAIPENALGVLKLRRRPQHLQPSEPGVPFSIDEPYYGGTRHDMLDEAGQSVGYVDTEYLPSIDPHRAGRFPVSGKKGVYVHMIQSSKTSPLTFKSAAKRGNRLASSIGVEDIKSLAPVIAEQFPEAEFMGGYRVSGVHADEKDPHIWVPLTRFRRTPDKS